jgi:hypothetical protein
MQKSQKIIQSYLLSDSIETATSIMDYMVQVSLY